MATSIFLPTCKRIRRRGGTIEPRCEPEYSQFLNLRHESADRKIRYFYLTLQRCVEQLNWYLAILQLSFIVFLFLKILERKINTARNLIHCRNSAPVGNIVVVKFNCFIQKVVVLCVGVSLRSIWVLSAP